MNKGSPLQVSYYQLTSKLQDRNNARLKMIQRTTRASVEEFKEKRRAASNTCKRKRGNGKMKGS
jgi:hypothetical protein